MHTNSHTRFDLPTSPGAGDARMRVHSHWQRWVLYAWVAGLLALPLLLPVLERNAGLIPDYLVAISLHAVIELFCATMALLIAGLILVLSRHMAEPALLLFALGFLVMGVLDGLHAITPPDVYPGLFVAAHTFSVLFGSVLLCTGGVLYYRRHRLGGSPAWFSREAAITLGVVVGVALVYHYILPSGPIEDGRAFSVWAHRVHEFSGLLYALAALLAFLFYRGTGQRLVLVIGAILTLFAESAYLFRFSHMWDSAWWTWHLVKTGIYLGSLVVIAAGLVLSLRAVQRSWAEQDHVNRRLRVAHDKLDMINRELRLRNAMVNASIGARSLDETLGAIEQHLGELVGERRFSLVLLASEDEAEEFQSSLRRQPLRWNVRVSSEPAPCAEPGQTGAGQDGGVRYSCGRGSEDRARMCLALRAQDVTFGHLCLELEGTQPTPTRINQLNAVAAEVGPIIHNALLHYRWTQSIAFRTALLRVTAMLNSTLELPRVLEAVCSESAQMLASDGSGILLAEPDNDQMRLISRCMPKAAGDAPDGGPPAWFASSEGQEFLQRLRDSGSPVALVKPKKASDQPWPFPLGANGCTWGSVALFPMVDSGRLIAVMLIVRTERIPFSAATLEQGELLAEQVRVALVHARSYEALRDTNEQLRKSEQERIRAERLAVLGQMAASVAHEVRNPLSAINNCLAILRRNTHNQDTSVSPAIEIIEDEVQRLDRLTHNFMSLGRLPRGAPSRVHLAALLDGICERLERHAEHEGIDVILECDTRHDHEPVLFDSDGFQEVLWNLMLNAVQAMRGKGRLRVRLRQTRGHAFVAVADDGLGVPLEARERIFEPFFTQRSEGAGLGLAIVIQHVEIWGGRLRIWGPPGACFALRFPVKAECAQDVEAVS